MSSASRPRVGVVVPVHGAAPFLEEALESALSQRPAPDALVVVDDGSPERVELTAAHAGRCRLVRREERGGPAAARATGSAETDTELVALLDADDAWMPGKLAAQLAALEAHPEIAVCFGRAQTVDADGRPLDDSVEEPPPGLLEGSPLAELLFERNPVPTSSAIVHRRALEAAGGFDGGVTGDWDWDLWLRLAERGERFWYEPAARVRYRRHGAGLTADLAAVAELGLAVQAAHAGLVDEQTRRRVRSRYLTLLARGEVRRRRYRPAREALGAAAREAPLGLRERALGLLLAVPGLRAGLGRRSPYR